MMQRINPIRRAGMRKRVPGAARSLLPGRLALLTSGLSGSLLFVLVAGAFAQSTGGQFTMDPVLIGGSGGAVQGGAFELHGSIGQAATVTLSGAAYALDGGFWALADTCIDPDIIFIDGFDGGPPCQAKVANANSTGVSK